MKKDTTISIRLSSLELDIICAEAKKAHLSHSNYVTQCCLGQQVVMNGLKEVLTELRRIGNNVNQLAEQFKNHEVLVYTHTDRNHLHSHLIINSVNFETGRKLHVDGDVIDWLKIVNDKVCAELGLPEFEPPLEQKAKPISS